MHPYHLSLLQLNQATSINKIEQVQSLWSGCGTLERIYFADGLYPTLIIKRVNIDKDLSTASLKRKAQSYQIERHWYAYYVTQTLTSLLIAQPLLIDEHSIIMRDLTELGFSDDYQSDHNEQQTQLLQLKAGLHWLAQLHGQFMRDCQTDPQPPQGLWPIGCYWHLTTREEEFARMQAGPLKDAAFKIDQRLNTTRYQTIVHGDAKVANACFSPLHSPLNSTNNVQASFIDFQYVGAGCGLKDVMYLLGSGLSSLQLEQYAPSLLDYYFACLRNKLSESNTKINITELEAQWRELYAVVWADFQRFLLGWNAEHYKLHPYSEKMTQHALQYLSAFSDF